MFEFFLNKLNHSIMAIMGLIYFYI